MKLLHTSDWHLGIALHNMPVTDCQEAFISTLLSIVRREKIDGVIIAGDIFDTSVSNAEAIALYNRAVTGLCGEIGIPVFVIAGNHDGAERLASCSELLKKAGLFVSGRLTASVEPICVGDCDFYLIPYFNTDEARRFFPDQDIKTCEQAMEAVCSDIRARMNRARKNIVIAHCFVSGTQPSQSDRSAVIGTLNCVSSEVFREFDYTALGHIHRQQSAGKAVCYSGTPMPYSFAEADQEKSVTVLDTDTMEISRIPMPQHRSMKVLTGTYQELVDSAVPDDSFIKIELTDRFAGLEAVGAFREFYPNLLTVSGKSPEDGTGMTLTVDDLERLTPQELLLHFYEEETGTAPDADQLRLFHDAFSEIQQEGELS